MFVPLWPSINASPLWNHKLPIYYNARLKSEQPQIRSWGGFKGAAQIWDGDLECFRRRRMANFGRAWRDGLESCGMSWIGWIKGQLLMNDWKWWRVIDLNENGWAPVSGRGRITVSGSSKYNFFRCRQSKTVALDESFQNLAGWPQLVLHYGSQDMDENKKYYCRFRVGTCLENQISLLWRVGF